MPVFGQTQMKHRCRRVLQKLRNDWPAPKVRPMRAPCRDDLIGPIGACLQGCAVVRPHRINRGPHVTRIRRTPRKDIGHAKALIKKGVDIQFVEKHIDKLLDQNIPQADKAIEFLEDIQD